MVTRWSSAFWASRRRPGGSLPGWPRGSVPSSRSRAIVARDRDRAQQRAGQPCRGRLGARDLDDGRQRGAAAVAADDLAARGGATSSGDPGARGVCVSQLVAARWRAALRSTCARVRGDEPRRFLVSRALELVGAARVGALAIGRADTEGMSIDGSGDLRSADPNQRSPDQADRASGVRSSPPHAAGDVWMKGAYAGLREPAAAGRRPPRRPLLERRFASGFAPPPALGLACCGRGPLPLRSVCAGGRSLGG